MKKVQDREKCGEPGCTGYLHLGMGYDGGHIMCPKLSEDLAAKHKDLDPSNIDTKGTSDGD